MIQSQKVLETTVRFSKTKKSLKLWVDWLSSNIKKLLKQRLDFPNKKKIETMDRLAIIQGRTIVETTVRFFN